MSGCLRRLALADHVFELLKACKRLVLPIWPPHFDQCRVRNARLFFDISKGKRAIFDAFAKALEGDFVIHEKHNYETLLLCQLKYDILLLINLTSFRILHHGL